MTIFGIDLVKGSPVARETPEYALVILCNGEIKEKHERISTFKQVSVFEDRTVLKISRARLPGRGAGVRTGTGERCTERSSTG